MTFKTIEDIPKKKKDSKLVFIVKAIIWFICTAAAGVWISTWFSAGWGLG